MSASFGILAIDAQRSYQVMDPACHIELLLNPVANLLLG